MDDYGDATLVLVGHGATGNRESAVPVQRLAGELRERGMFYEVLECYWMVEPHLTKVWKRVRTRAVYIVPVTISDGYFTTELIPEQLGLPGRGETAAGRFYVVGEHWVFYARPIGSHPSMTDALLGRAREVVERYPADPPAVAEATALFIVGHGTERNRLSRAAVEREVARIRERGLYREVHGTFMLEAPLVADCWSATAARDLVMVPFFISDGLHTAEDIPILLGEREEGVRRRARLGALGCPNPLRHGCRRLWYASALGTDPGLAGIVLERVRESEGADGRVGH